MKSSRALPTTGRDMMDGKVAHEKYKMIAKEAGVDVDGAIGAFTRLGEVMGTIGEAIGGVVNYYAARGYRCPNCQTLLMPGELRCYETLDEHVRCRWNYEDPPDRPTFFCPNTECWFFNNGYWDQWGDGPYGQEVFARTHDCYSGFYHEAINAMYGKTLKERPHPPPERPLTRADFCSHHTCYRNGQCGITYASWRGGFYEPEYLNEIITSQCCDYNEEAVTRFFKKYDGIPWHPEE